LQIINMSYNRVNILNKIIEVQELTLSLTRRGVTQEWVYKNLIYPKFYLSRTTYYKYLSTNAKREMEIIRSKKLKQLCLFNENNTNK
jgi:hypothetical protein